MRISDWSSDVCSSDLQRRARRRLAKLGDVRARDKGLAGADQHHGLDGIVGQRARHAVADAAAHGGGQRSEERSVGQESVSECRSRWSSDHSNKKKDTEERLYT